MIEVSPKELYNFLSGQKIKYFFYANTVKTSCILIGQNREQKYQQLETVHLSKGQKLSRLKELSKMYALFAPIQVTYKESQPLKGLVKMRYDKEHTDGSSKYAELKGCMRK